MPPSDDAYTREDSARERGEPLLPFQLHADEPLARGERIAFNAGSLSRSIILATEDWLRVARPRVLSHAVPEG